MSLLSPDLAIDNGKVREIGKGDKYSSEFIAEIQKFFDDGTFVPEDLPIYGVINVKPYASCLMIAVKDGKVVHRTAIHGDFEDTPEQIGVLDGILFRYWLKDNKLRVEVPEIIAIGNDHPHYNALPPYDDNEYTTITYPSTVDTKRYWLSIDGDNITTREAERGAELGRFLDTSGKIIVSADNGIVRLSEGDRILTDIEFEPTRHSIDDELILLADRRRLCIRRAVLQRGCLDGRWHHLECRS
jgi:hypothetical protein